MKTLHRFGNYLTQLSFRIGSGARRGGVMGISLRSGYVMGIMQFLVTSRGREIAQVTIERVRAKDREREREISLKNEERRGCL